MTSYELTEKEVAIIENLRKIQKIDCEKLNKKLNEFVKKTDELEKIVNEIYDLHETNKEARELIEVEIDTCLLTNLYTAFNDFTF